MERLPELEAFVKQYLIENDIPLERAKNSVVDFIVYGYKKAKWSSSVGGNFTKKYFASKPHRIRILTYIFCKNNIRYCYKCNKLLSFNDFRPFVYSSATGTASTCRECSNASRNNWRSTTEKGIIGHRNEQAKRRAAKLQRLPKWCDLNIVKEIYSNCPEGHHVDHIIPLQGEKVSGLHVPENLQYLTISENCSKGNKFQIE